MDVISITICGEPVPKARARAKPGQRAYTPARTRKAEDKLREVFRDFVGDEPPSTRLVSFTCKLYRSTRHRYDIDNGVKTVMDAANGILFADDSQVVILHAEKHLDRNMPRTVVTIRYLDAS